MKLINKNLSEFMELNIDKSIICKEDFWLIRSQISKFWINKDLDLRYFYRKEIPITDRL